MCADAIQLVREGGHDSVREMAQLAGLIDVVIPRGGAALIRSVKECARVPVIETGLGVCHAYVDASADIDMAARIVENGKCSRPSVCNALETLLVHRDIAARNVLVDAGNVCKVNRCCRLRINRGSSLQA